MGMGGRRGRRGGKIDSMVSSCMWFVSNVPTTSILDVRMHLIPFPSPQSRVVVDWFNVGITSHNEHDKDIINMSLCTFLLTNNIQYNLFHTHTHTQHTHTHTLSSV